MTKVTAEQLDTIKAELLKKGFKYRQSNGIHNFVNAAIKEGIEIKGSDCSVRNAFWMDTDDTRKYGYDVVGNDTRDALAIIEQIMMGTEQEMIDEAAVHEAELINPPSIDDLDLDGPSFGIIPKYLTDELIARHPGTIKTLISMQKTAPMHIKEREKGLKYVDTAYMTTALNWATLMDWSFEVIETREDDITEYNSNTKKDETKKHFSVLGCLTIHTTEGKTIMKQQWGSQVLKAKMEVGDALKAAASDALKKGASMLGIAADVYGGAV